MMLKKRLVFISYRSLCFANVTLQHLIFESKIIFDDKFDHSSINQFHNILRLLDVLPNFLFTTSETMGHYYLET